MSNTIALNELDYSIHYRTWHDESDNHANMMADSHVNMLRPMLEGLPRGRALDIGCGMGFGMLALNRLGFKSVEGIDVDRSQIEACRKRGLRVTRCADVTEYLESQREPFDIILLMDVLEHIPVSEQIHVLRSIRNSLAAHGTLIVQTPNANSPLASRWRYIDFTHTCSFTEHSLSFVLKSAGFNSVSINTSQNHRPSLRLWNRNIRSGFSRQLRRWIVRWAWGQVMKAELGPDFSVADSCLDLNLVAVASVE